MDAEPPFEVTLQLSLPNMPDVTTHLHLRHAEWNHEPLLRKDFLVTRECHWDPNSWENTPDVICKSEAAEVLETVQDCQIEFLGLAEEAYGNISVTCRKLLPGTDQNFERLLQNESLIHAKENTELHGQVVLAHTVEEAQEAARQSARAVVLLSENTEGLPRSLPTFLVDLERRPAFLPSGTRILKYSPKLPEAWSRFSKGFDFFQEVHLYLSGEEPWLSTRHRVYEMIKAVSLEGLDGAASETLQRLRKALRISVTKPAKSLFEQIDGATEQEVLQCFKLSDTSQVSQDARRLHEASQCFPLMWDKVQMAGPPYPQVWDGGMRFSELPDIQAWDAFQVHPVCARLSLAFMAAEMSRAPYPNITGDGWSVSAFWDSAFKANPWWLQQHLVDYCLQPDTAVCTSFTVCWGMLLRHVTKLIHPFCDEKAHLGFRICPAHMIDLALSPQHPGCTVYGNIDVGLPTTLRMSQENLQEHWVTRVHKPDMTVQGATVSRDASAGGGVPREIGQLTFLKEVVRQTAPFH